MGIIFGVLFVVIGFISMGGGFNFDDAEYSQTCSSDGFFDYYDVYPVGVLYNEEGEHIGSLYVEDYNMGTVETQGERFFIQQEERDRTNHENLVCIARNSRTITNNLKSISERFSWFAGLFVICLGLITICAFGVVLSSCSKKRTATNLSHKQVSIG